MSSFDEIRSGLLKKYNVSAAGKTGSTIQQSSGSQRTPSQTNASDFYTTRSNLLDKYSEEKTEQRRNAVSDWAARYNNAMQGISNPSSRSGNWYTKSAIDSFGSDIDALIQDYDSIKDYAGRLGIPNSQRYLKELKKVQFQIQKESGWYKKYQGSGHEDVARLLSSMRNGEERRWLEENRYEVYKTVPGYRELSDAGLNALAAENDRNAADREEESWFEAISRYLGKVSDTTMPLGDTGRMTSEYRKDTTYREPADNWTRDQRSTYGYLYNVNPDVAYDYAVKLSEDYRRAENQQKLDAVQEWATKNGKNAASGTVAAIAMMPLSLADTLNALMEYNARGTISTPSAPTPGQLSEAITGAVGQSLNGKHGTISEKIPVIGGKGWGDAYQLGTSIANSLLSAYTQGGVGTDILFFGSAASSTMYSAKDRGATDEQAIKLGILSGLAEAAGEHFSIEGLIGMSEAKTMKAFFGNVLKQSGIEASEEGFTTLMNNFADQLIMGQDSTFYEKVRVYMSENGMSEQEAKKQAWKDMAEDLAFDMVGGALSGGFSTAIQTGAQKIFGDTDQAQTHHEPLTTELADAEKHLATNEESSEVAPDNEPSAKAADTVTNLEKVVAENAKTSVGTSKMEKTIQLTPDIESFSAQFGKQAEAVKRNYMEGQDVQEYEVGFQTAYTMGREGGNRDAMAKHVPYLSQSQKEIAFQLGTEAADAARAAEPKKEVTTARITAEDGSLGDTVNVAEIVSMDNNNMTFRLEDGRTVTDDDLSFDKGQKVLASVWELGMDVKSANTILAESAANTAEEAAQAAGIEEAYRYGAHGYSMKQLTQRGIDAGALTDGQRQAAWNAGQISRQQAAAAAPQAAATGKSTGIYFDAGNGNVTAFSEETMRGLTGKRKAGVQAAMVLQKLGIGQSYHFFESYVNEAGDRVYKDANGAERTAPNGWYDSSDGSIHIDLNAGTDGEGLTLYTLSHELTHFVEQWSKPKYQALADSLVEWYGKGASVDELVMAKQAELSKSRGAEVSYEEAYSEFIADSMEAMLSDGNVLEKLIELKKTDRGLFDKMREFFDNLARKIRDIYKGLTPDSAEGRAVLEMKDQIEQIQQLFAEALVDAGENFRSASDGQKNTAQEGRQFSDRKKPGEYGGIREVLAKKGLDELSVKLGNQFPLSAKFDKTIRNNSTQLVMEDVAANSVKKNQKESAFKVGRKVFTSKYGAKTSVHIAQMGIDADLYADVANESISKAIGQTNEQSTLDVIPHIGNILSNSILMGVERIAHTDNKGTALYGYRLYNLYWYVDGNKKTPHALVCTVVQDLNKAEGYVFKNIENVTIGRGLPGTNAGMSSSVNGDTYTVAQLYEAVKRIDRNEGGLKYSDSDRNYLFSYTERDDGVAYQDRSTGTSNRALLAGAFEELVTSPEELKFIRQYQENVALLNEQEEILQELRSQIREISFGKGERDVKKMKQLQEEATKTANGIDIYDRKLLKLERAKPLRDVLEREREKVRKTTRQKGQEAMEAYREKRKESAAKKEARRKIRKTVMELNKLLNRGDKKKNVKDGMSGMVSKSLKLAEALFMDEYSNRDMLRNGVGIQMTDAEEAAFRDAYALLERIESDSALAGKEFGSEMEAMEYLRKLDGQLSGKMAKLKDVFARERKRLYGTTVSDLLGQLADEYSRLSEAEDGAVRAAKDENVHAHLLQLQKDVGGVTVRDMTLSQMEMVADAYTMVLTTVRNANKMFASNLKFRRDTLAGMVMGEIGAAAKKISKLVSPVKDAADRFSWNNLKPIYAFERLGSETLKTLFGNIRKGQDVWAVDMQEADAFRREQYKKHKRKEWDLEKQHSFEFESGKVQLSLEQIMSLYAYSRREQALDHLLKGGFVFGDSTEVIVKKNGIKRRYLKKDATAYNLSADDLLQIIDTLNAEQKAFVEEMQTYLSDVMGGKGNEISLQMYGIKSFGEKNYFPIRSAGQYMEKAKEDSFRKEQGQISIVNSGFTKAVAPKANNPITLDGFMDVWAEHVNDMAMYHGFVLPMEDFRRVYNYSTPNVEEANSQSVNAAIENAFGKAATGYIDQLYKDLNGGAVSDNRENLSKKLVSLHKKAAVFASGSVAIQQPSAFVRAFALVNPKHFIGPKVNRQRHKQLWAEVKKYAPVAFVKEMGYFDTGMGRSAKDYLQAEEYSGIREKMDALFKDADYRDELLGKAPALADEMTWCMIWEAVKRETRARNPALNVKSDAFLKLAGERFSEVIDKTQVYDSVLSRSANMRSKALHMNMMTSFLAEPTTSINMLEDAVRKGDRKQLKRTVGAVYGSVVLNALLVSLVYAARDADEDKTFWEKYLGSVAVEVLDGINPITYYPFLRDIWSIGQGYDVERADMSLISDFTNAAKKVISAGQKLQEAAEDEEAAAMEKFKNALWGMVDSVAGLTGLPVKNIRRDIEGAKNMVKTISKDLAGRKTTDLSLQDAVLADVMNTIPIGNLLYSKSKRDRLYGAMVAGDTAYVQRLKAGYESDSSYHSAIRLALRDHDSRIWEAAIAWNGDDLDTYMSIAMEIIGEKHFTQDDIVMAIRAEASSMIESESSSSGKAKGYFTNEKFGVAMGQNNVSMANAIRDDLIDTAMANGKTREEAKKTVQSTARTQLKQLYADGTITGTNAEKMLVKYGGYDQADAADKVAEWKYEKDYPELDGRITYSQYKRWEVDGKSRGVTLETFTEVAEYRGGNTSSGVRNQDDVAAYINSMPISTTQKDALWCCFWSESTLYKNAPWH